MEVTARETLAWWRTLPAERQAAIKTGFTPEREKALLELWHARGPGCPSGTLPTHSPNPSA